MAFNNTLSTLLSDPVRNFKFVVTFKPHNQDGKWGPNFGKMGFVSVSGLSVSTEPISYREGGYNTNTHQIPGQSAFSPITMAKGVMLGQPEHSLWMKRLFSVLTPSATSGVGANFRCDLDIQVLSHPNPAAFADNTGTGGPVSPVDQHTSLRFQVYNAWITSLTYGNLDAGGSSLMVEDITIVHEGFDVSYATGYAPNQSAKDILDAVYN